MKTKVLELRDRMTFIPLLCVDMNPDVELVNETADAERVVATFDAQRYLLRRCGYPCDGKPNIAITKVDATSDPCSNDPYSWKGRTMGTAHLYIIEHWDELKDGDVVDVEFILGERPTPKVSERESAPL